MIRRSTTARLHPLNPYDRSRLLDSLRVMPFTRACRVDFGGRVRWVTVRPRPALLLAEKFRGMVRANFGALAYDPTVLPITITVHPEKMLIESRFERMCMNLEASPEVFLAWADQLETAAQSLLAVATPPAAVTLAAAKPDTGPDQPSHLAAAAAVSLEKAAD